MKFLLSLKLPTIMIWICTIANHSKVNTGITSLSLINNHKVEVIKSKTIETIIREETAKRDSKKTNIIREAPKTKRKDMNKRVKRVNRMMKSLTRVNIFRKRTKMCGQKIFLKDLT